VTDIGVAAPDEPPTPRPFTSTGALGSGSAFTAIAPAGTFRNTAVNFDEVGAITLRAHVADASYLGAGDVLGTASGNVGRFTPHHFAATVDPVAFATGCQAGGFTYLEKPFTFSPGLHPAIHVTAQSLANTTTANYAGTWFRMTPASITPRTWTALTGTLDSAGPNAPSVVDQGNGLGLVSLDQGPSLAFVRSTPAAPFDAEIGISVTLLDADGVAYTANPLRIGQAVAGSGVAFQDGKEMRFGRLAFQNAYGAEVRALAVPLRAEHFDGLRFVANAADTCSDVPFAQLAATKSPVTLPTTPAIANHPLVAGSAGLTLSAPGAGNTGSVLLGVNLATGAANLPWLRYDWNGDGTHAENPSGTGTFGVYKGSDAVVDVRERY
jgi:MSHA biogenesis protein MshQ